MIDINDLKEKIRTTIFPNGRGAINAADHQALLLDMADGMGAMNDKLNEVATDTESNNVAIEDLQENKVDHGSYAPDLSVGVADHLAGHDEPTPSEFTFRKSGGGAILSGNARVQSVKGNSVVWNQLINNILSDTTYQKAWYPRRGVNYASVQNGEIELRFDSQSDAFGNSLRQQIDVRPGDKIYISYDYESHNVDEFGRRVFMAFTAGWSSKAVLSDNCLAKGGEVVGHAEGFSIVPSDNSINALCIYFCYTNITSPDTTPLKIANFRFVNLTRMYGAGNEPTTIEDFYSRIPQGIDTNAYNEGEVIHMNVDAVKSVGFNAWDEQWEVGQINVMNGEAQTSSNTIRSKKFCDCLPNETYYAYCAGYSNEYYLGIVWYDAYYNYISFKYAAGRTIQAPSNARYFKLTTNTSSQVNYGTTYNNDICINISNIEKNGIYESYIRRMQSLDIIRKYFPQGMKSAGSAHDEIRYNKATQKWEAVKRIGEVDLGSLVWDGNPKTYYTANVPAMQSEGSRIDGLICSCYPLSTYTGINENMIDKAMLRFNQTIIIKDSSYTDISSFKAAMQGVILYYELANPIVTEIEEAFNLDYEVWNGGTEQAIADTPTSAFKADIIYGFNAYGVIKELREQLATLQAAIAKMNV